MTNLMMKLHPLTSVTVCFHTVSKYNVHNKKNMLIIIAHLEKEMPYIKIFLCSCFYFSGSILTQSVLTFKSHKHIKCVSGYFYFNLDTSRISEIVAMPLDSS